MISAVLFAALVVSEGRVVVPESRTGAMTASIEVAYVRVGRSEKPSKTAHFILAGGPGDSGMRLVKGLAQRGDESLLALFDGDIIGIDQRGTGASLPSLRVQRTYDLPLDQPGSPELWLPLMAKTCREIAAELTARGIDLKSYNTRESADDIDDVRRTLGYERITLWGRSYGTHLALATLRRHEKRIDRVILANPEGPDHTFKLPSQFDRVIDRLDLRSSMRSVFEQLEREPVFVEVAHPTTGDRVRIGIGKFDLQLLTAHVLGDPSTAASISAAFNDMAHGDSRAVARLVIAQRLRMSVQSAMQEMMDLSSGATSARRAQINREAASSLLGNAINFPRMDLGDAWGNPDLGDAFRAPVRSNVPVLILAGELDPRTPVANGEEIVRTLPQGKLIVLEGKGHQFDIFGSAEIRATIAEFLKR